MDVLEWPGDPGFQVWLRAQRNPADLVAFTAEPHKEYVVAGEWDGSEPKVRVMCRRQNKETEKQLYIDKILNDQTTGCRWHILEVDTRPVVVRVMVQDAWRYEDYTILILPTASTPQQATLNQWQSDLQEWCRIRSIGIASPDLSFCSDAYALALQLLTTQGQQGAVDIIELLRQVPFETAQGLAEAKKLLAGITSSTHYVTAINNAHSLLQRPHLLKQ